jgi:hypothetical protein
LWQQNHLHFLLLLLLLLLLLWCLLSSCQCRHLCNHLLLLLHCCSYPAHPTATRLLHIHRA